MKAELFIELLLMFISFQQRFFFVLERVTGILIDLKLRN
jgi:hypothetical protein